MGPCSSQCAKIGYVLLCIWLKQDERRDARNDRIDHKCDPCFGKMLSVWYTGVSAQKRANRVSFASWRFTKIRFRSREMNKTSKMGP